MVAGGGSLTAALVVVVGNWLGAGKRHGPCPDMGILGVITGTLVRLARGTGVMFGVGYGLYTPLSNGLSTEAGCVVIGRVEAMGVLIVEKVIPSADLMAVGYNARRLACLALMRLVNAWL